MLEVTIPNVRTDQRLAAEFRPRKLEPWLARLPRTDRESGFQQLYKALSTQNRVALDASVRLQLMEMYLAPFRELFGLHHADLRVLSRTPLHPHYRARQEEMLSMLDAMAAGYKIAALDLVAGRRGHGRDTGLGLAVQRAIYCLGEVLVTAFELYMRPPGGTWREVHELYRCAETDDLCSLEIASLPDLKGSTDILGTYVPVLLLGAASPYGLVPGEARRLYELAPQWRRSARITTPAAPPDDPGHFRFDLDADAPPIPVSKSNQPMAQSTRILRTLGVARAMHEALTDMNDDVAPTMPDWGVQPADAELFRRAGRVLGEVDIKRSSNRFPARQDIELHFSFDAVCFACGGGRPPGQETPANHAVSEAPDPAAGAAGEQFIDLSEPMLGVAIDGDRAPGQPDRSVSGRYTPRRARCANQSAGGLCAVLPHTGDTRLKVGDIAASRATGAQDWQIGVVRWLRATSRELRLGLQFLGPVAVPVTAVLDTGGAGNGEDGSGDGEVAAIWLPENAALKLANAMILPRAAEPYPAHIGIRGGDDVPARVSLLRRIESTGDYERFVVSLDVSGPASHSSRSS